MMNNDALPRIKVDPKRTKCRPTASSCLRAGGVLPMAQRYFLF